MKEKPGQPDPAAASAGGAKRLLQIALALTIAAVALVTWMTLRTADLFGSVHAEGGWASPEQHLRNAACIRFASPAAAALAAAALICAGAALRRASGRWLHVAVAEIALNALVLPQLFFVHWTAWPAAVLSLCS